MKKNMKKMRMMNSEYYIGIDGLKEIENSVHKGPLCSEEQNISYVRR